MVGLVLIALRELFFSIVKANKVLKQERGNRMLKFIDDLAGAIYDLMAMILKGLSYFIAGTLIVGIPLYVIAWIFDAFGHMFS